MISVSCSCGRRFKAEDHHAGKRTRCPVCGTPLMIGHPGVSAPEIPASLGGVSSSSVIDNGEVPSWWFPVSDGPGARPAASSVAAPPTTHSGTGSGSGSAGSTDPDEIQTAIFPQQPAAGRRHRAILASLGAGLCVCLIGGVALIWLSTHRPGREGLPGPEVPGGPDRTAVVAPKAGPEIPAEAGPLPAGNGPRLRVLVPAYFYPAGEGLKDWKRLAEAAGKVKVVVIANTNSGPGDRRNPDYSQAIRQVHDAGAAVIGYVDTKYGARPIAEIRSDIDRWVEFYPQIGGFFLDQQSAKPLDVPTYLEARDAARRKIKDALLVDNPGALCDEAYVTRQCADATCVFASYEGFDALRLPASYGTRDPSRFAALTYQVRGVNAMRQTIQAAILKRIGYIYVSDSPKGDNPWSRLPTYWNEEIEAIHGAE